VRPSQILEEQSSAKNLISCDIFKSCLVYYIAAPTPGPEKGHLTPENINDVLNERLPKQSRIQGTDVIDYLSQFLFAPIDVTDDHNTSVSYDLPGPDNCKVFPGDSTWPSSWSWAGLELDTLGGLIKSVPMSQVCDADGTGSADKAACAALAPNWDTAKFMYVSTSYDLFASGSLLTSTQKR
jgi:hypothetical protein